jgi:hypothetical protein
MHPTPTPGSYPSLCGYDIINCPMAVPTYLGRYVSATYCFAYQDSLRRLGGVARCPVVEAQHQHDDTFLGILGFLAAYLQDTGSAERDLDPWL